MSDFARVAEIFYMSEALLSKAGLSSNALFASLSILIVCLFTISKHLTCSKHSLIYLCVLLFQTNEEGDCLWMQPLTFLMAIENLLTKTTAEKMALPLNLTTGMAQSFHTSIGESSSRNKVKDTVWDWV